MMPSDRLWSLGELIELLADDFVDAVRTIATATQALVSAQREAARQDKLHINYSCTRHWGDVMVKSLRHIERAGGELGFPGSRGAARRILPLFVACLDNSDNDEIVLSGEDFHRVVSGLSQINIGLKDEMYGRKVFALSPAEEDYYVGGVKLFGDAVVDAFPDAVEDIAEAGKCFACGRYTASVFHLMRVMERAVHMLGKKLAVTVTDKNNKELVWGLIASNIGESIKKMPKGQNKDEWSQVHSLLVSVKDAWRNNTMHPKGTYTEDEAKVVFDAVRGFMGRFAILTGAPEAG